MKCSLGVLETTLLVGESLNPLRRDPKEKASTSNRFGGEPAYPFEGGEQEDSQARTRVRPNPGRGGKSCGPRIGRNLMSTEKEENFFSSSPPNSRQTERGNQRGGTR